MELPRPGIIMEKEFIELFKGYEGDFGIAHLS
mgnify:CR=1